MNIKIATCPSAGGFSQAVAHWVLFDRQTGISGVYMLVKTSIYCLTMPNNKRPEGVSDLVAGTQAVAFKIETPSRQTECCKMNYSVCLSSPSSVSTRII